MKIDNPSGDPDCHKPSYNVRFEPREVEELKTDYPRAAFERVRDVSEMSEALYRTFVSPWVRAFTTPWSAEMLKWLHPMRASRYLLSEAFNPGMCGIALLAESIARSRQPLPADHPLIAREHAAFAAVGEALEAARKARDATYELGFASLYGDSRESARAMPNMRQVKRSR